MLQLKQGENEQILRQRAMKNAGKIHSVHLHQTFSFLNPPQPIGQLFRITQMLVKNATVPIKKAGQPVNDLYFYERFRAEVKPKMSAFVDSLIGFNIQNVDEKIWEEAKHIWNSQINDESQIKLMKMSFLTQKLFIWCLSVLKLYELSKK